MRDIITIIAVLLNINLSLFSQTSEYGNLEIYSRETSFSAFGYFSGSFPVSDFIGGERIDFNGVNYTNYYDLARITEYNISNQVEFRFLLKGAFKIGGAYGNVSVNNSAELYPKDNLKYYMINLDLFCLSFQPEITYVFKHGSALTFFFGLDIINVGGNGAILEEGQIVKHTIASLNIIPLSFRPGLLFDFGSSSLGIAGQINSNNILEYRVLSKELYPGKSGINSFEAFVRKYEFQIIFTF
ncbi:MAG: hypothetical protein M5U17_05635 [Ignavibacterium sp.]|nr:hypothetical protein [Ignavibacterium sp.]